MSVCIIKAIYDNSFTSYLQYSKLLGDYVYQQAFQVDNLMKVLINLLELTQRYNRPQSLYVEDYLKLPIVNGIHEVKKVTLLDKDYEFYHHLVYISEAIELFEWIHEVNNMNVFAETIVKSCHPSKEALELDLKSLSDVHMKWFKAWQDTFDELIVLITSFYKNGLTWHGDRVYSSADMFGDVTTTTTTFRMPDRQAVLKEICKGEEIVESLKIDMPEVSKDLRNALKNLDEIDKNSQVFKEDENKWRIEHQKGEHKSLVINTATKEDLVFIYNCENCTIMIGNEIDTVRMDRCTKVTIMSKCTLNAIELIDNHECQIHSFDGLGRLQLMCCQDIVLFLTEKAFAVKIYTEKCTGIFLNFPGNDNKFKKRMIREKFVTTIDPSGTIKTCVDGDLF